MGSIEDRTITLADGAAVTIRTAATDDAPRVLEYLRAVLDESPMVLTEPDELDLTVEQERDWLAARLGDPRQVVLLALAEGRIVGFVSLSTDRRRRTRHDAQLGITVRRAWRRRGVGRALMNAAIDWARANALLERISLGVLAHNAPAISLYRALGFVEEGRRRRACRLGAGRYDDAVEMALFVHDGAEGECRR